MATDSRRDVNGVHARSSKVVYVRADDEDCSFELVLHDQQDARIDSLETHWDVVEVLARPV